MKKYQGQFTKDEEKIHAIENGNKLDLHFKTT